MTVPSHLHSLLYVGPEEEAGIPQALASHPVELTSGKSRSCGHLTALAWTPFLSSPTMETKAVMHPSHKSLLLPTQAASSLHGPWFGRRFCADSMPSLGALGAYRMSETPLSSYMFRIKRFWYRWRPPSLCTQALVAGHLLSRKLPLAGVLSPTTSSQTSKLLGSPEPDPPHSSVKPLRISFS